MNSHTESLRPHRTALTVASIGALCAVAFITVMVLLQGPLNHDQADASTRATQSTHATSNSRADGAIAEGELVTLDDTDHAAVSGLDPALLQAVQAAAVDAREQGIEFTVSSGWRSPEYQRYLLEEAVSEYGSAEEAAKWVATPETSSHVFGEAIDLGPTDAMYWVQRYGAAYGLCQTYANEVWHYELHPEAPTEGCPAPYTDPTEDPRLQG